MELCSTSNPNLRVSWREAVLNGLASDGGLYLPVHIPSISSAEREKLRTLSFSELALVVAQKFLEHEVAPDVLREICTDAFDFSCIPHQLDDTTYILELFHGPTCAFKDFGARFMARLFRHFWGKQTRPLTVLVATSGDTGSAVANAFLDQSPDPLIRVAILFPRDKASEVQRKQMTTLGHNVTAFEVDGSFDDCQSLVKRALRDESLLSRIALTSANSINIARLLPQMFYYAYAALQLSHKGPLTFSVPSGNLGNLTGGLLSHLCGFQAKHFIAACNTNRTFADFISTGSFKPAPSEETISNAMDVGNPSNFHRIISLYNGDINAIRLMLSSYSINDIETCAAMKQIYSRYGYLLDPHTAVGVAALLRHRESHPQAGVGVVLSTAHPAKFSRVVEEALGVCPDAPQQLRECLAKNETLLAIPRQYQALVSNLLGSGH